MPYTFTDTHILFYDMLVNLIVILKALHLTKAAGRNEEFVQTLQDISVFDPTIQTCSFGKSYEMIL